MRKRLSPHGVPTKVVWYCGGTAAASPPVNDGGVVKQATDGLARPLRKGRSDRWTTGPQFEWVDQHGTQFSSNTYPVPTGQPLIDVVQHRRRCAAATSAHRWLGTRPPEPYQRVPSVRCSAFRPAPRAINAVELTIPQATTTTLHRRRAAADADAIPGTGTSPRIRTVGRRQHGSGVGQPRHAGAGDVGRRRRTRSRCPWRWWRRRWNPASR